MKGQKYFLHFGKTKECVDLIGNSDDEDKEQTLPNKRMVSFSFEGINTPLCFARNKVKKKTIMQAESKHTQSKQGREIKYEAQWRKEKE